MRYASLVIVLVSLVMSPFAAADDGALVDMIRPGRAVDTAQFSHRRRIRLYPSAAGVSRYALAPVDMALARADLADVRIVDEEGRQASYLVQRDRRERMAAEVTRLPSEGAQSRYALGLPASPLAVVAVEIHVAARSFDRDYRVVARRGGREVTVGSGRLERREHDGSAIGLALVGEHRADSLLLFIDDGDDAPLMVEGATVTIIAADLLVVAEPGPYRLVLGNDEVRPPRYELSRVAASVARAPAGEAHAGPLEANPDHRPQLEVQPEPPQDSSLLLWAAIALSVLILGGLTLRVCYAA